MDTQDHTAIPIHLDPIKRVMRGVAIHGNTPFEAPYISHIEGNLYMGGCEDGMILPDNIEFVVSLYPWGRYEIGPDVERMEFTAYDAAIEDGPFELAAEYAHQFIQRGPTLVHCQAGLNRSGLVSALVLMKDGKSAADAIALLRERRSRAVLCNRDFEEHLLARETA